MKKTYLLVFGILLFLMPSGALAACSSDRLAELSKIAENVNVDYTYEIGTTDAEFKVVFSNVTSDIYVIDMDTDMKYSGSGELISQLTFRSGESKIFSIYSNDNNCKGQALTSKYITFPVYNVYSSYTECDGYEDYKLCKQWVDLGGMDEDEFYSAIEKYKKSLNEEPKKVEEKKNFVTFVKENYKSILLATVGVIVLLTLIIVFVVKRKKQDKLL